MSPTGKLTLQFGGINKLGKLCEPKGNRHAINNGTEKDTKMDNKGDGKEANSNTEAQKSAEPALLSNFSFLLHLSKRIHFVLVFKWRLLSMFLLCSFWSAFFCSFSSGPFREPKVSNYVFFCFSNCSPCVSYCFSKFFLFVLRVFLHVSSCRTISNEKPSKIEKT